MRRISAACATLLLIIGGGETLQAQQPFSSVYLSDLQPLAGEFVAATGAIGLRNGEVLVLDNIAGAIFLVSSTSSRQLGRTGKGPNEYISPTRVWSWRGDSLAIHDEGNWRFLIVDPKTFRGRTISLTNATTRQVKGADRLGRIYYQGSDLAGVEPDSMAMLRTDGVTLDTIGKIGLPDRRPLAEIGGVPVDGVDGALSMFRPFASGDDWCVGLDGTVAVLRSEPFHLEWYIPGQKMLIGERLPYHEVPITQRDRDEYKAVAAATTLTIPGGNGGRVIRPSQDPKMPKAKPPFVRSTARMDPLGRVWVQASGTSGRFRRCVHGHRTKCPRCQSRTLASPRPPSRVCRRDMILTRPDEDGIEHVYRAPTPAL
jgi:hypothetical protein